jgi:hypothetical protein
VGGDFALEETPFKYPLYIILPGAVFFVQEGYSRPKGSLIPNIHPHSKIVQIFILIIFPSLSRRSSYETF